MDSRWGMFLLLAPWVAAADVAADVAACSSQLDAGGVAACTRAIESGKLQGEDLVEVHMQRALLYIGIVEDDSRAIADYTEVIRLDPDHRQAYGLRGSSRMETGDVAAAVRDYDKAIELAEFKHIWLDARGEALTRLGQHDRAIADHDEALRQLPEFADDSDRAEIIRHRAMAWRAKGDARRARADYEKAARLCTESTQKCDRIRTELKQLGPAKR